MAPAGLREEPSHAELEALRPGDMVFAKLGVWPWWPGTISLCFQKKHKNVFRLNKDPANAKLWVSFFNESSANWCHFSRIRVFCPKTAKEFLLRPGENFYAKQKVAIEMATEDYKRLHPDAVEEDEASPFEPEESADTDPSDREVEAEVKPARRTPKTVSNGSSRKRRGNPRSKVSAPVEEPKRKKARGKAASVSTIPRLAQEPSEEDQAVADAEAEEGTSEVGERRNEKHGEAMDVDSTANEGEDIDTVPNRDASPVKASKRSRKVGVESVTAGRSRKEESIEDLTALVKTLRRKLKEKEKTVVEREKVIAQQEETVAELKGKVTKLRAKTKSDKVRITLPDLPPDPPFVAPSSDEYAVTEVGLKELRALVSKLEADFLAFEKHCVEAVSTDEALTGAAKEAVAKLQPLFNKSQDASAGVVRAEQAVAKGLRTVFGSKVTADDIMESEAGKLVSRISRRSTANSPLLAGLASAIRTQWMKMLAGKQGKSQTPPKAKDGNQAVSRGSEGVAVKVEKASGPATKPTNKCEDEDVGANGASVQSGAKPRGHVNGNGDTRDAGKPTAIDGDVGEETNGLRELEARQRSVDKVDKVNSDSEEKMFKLPSAADDAVVSATTRKEEGAQDVTRVGNDSRRDEDKQCADDGKAENGNKQPVQTKTGDGGEGDGSREE